MTNVQIGQRPAICAQCGSQPVIARGLCTRCYRAKWVAEHPDRVRAAQQAYRRRRREEQLEGKPAPLPQSDRICAQCEARMAATKGLCGRCYQAKRRQERREANPEERKAPRICTNCKDRVATRKGLCLRCYQAERRRQQPDLVRAVNRLCYLRNRDERLADMRRYYAIHAEEINARRRESRRDHPGATSVSNRASGAQDVG
jgi:hypothetical protein